MPKASTQALCFPFCTPGLLGCVGSAEWAGKHAGNPPLELVTYLSAYFDRRIHRAALSVSCW